ncbi:cuticle protein 16.8-like [Centruroides sculpturatus]|uniref:cuticle protein 16.8-like n=1 Tax=Centruroides sculpturatus TaxID=218467 RepID=UPI000C6EF2D4|nr:cuticle protein 16.8-like [Centruroides sculpturatus]
MSIRTDIAVIFTILVLFALTAYSRGVPTPYGYVPTVKVAPAVKVAYPAAKVAYPAAYVEKPQPYNFGYDIKDEQGNKQWRNEAGDEYGTKKGSYGYIDAFGIQRHVEYLAGPEGFKAWIKTNEPGTQSSNPADVQIISEPAPIKQIAVVPKVYKPVLKVPYKPVSYAYAAPPYVPPKVIYKTSPLAVKPIYPAAVPVLKSYY